MEGAKTNEQELTSTMGNLLSTSKEEKNDASDSTPTSSTDAFTTTATSQIAPDDPISSTSSDVLDAKKVNDIGQSSTSNMSLLKDMSGDQSSSPFASEKDLLDMNITDTSTEKIMENVDDIVQDLENLLGEPTTSFDFTVRSKGRKSMAEAENRNIAADIDVFSAELQMLAEQTSEPMQTSKEPVKAISPENPPSDVVESAVDATNLNIQTDNIESANDSTNLNTEQISTNSKETMCGLKNLGERKKSHESQSNELSSNSAEIKDPEEAVCNEETEKAVVKIVSDDGTKADEIVEIQATSSVSNIEDTESTKEEERTIQAEENTEQVVNQENIVITSNDVFNEPEETPQNLESKITETSETSMNLDLPIKEIEKQGEPMEVESVQNKDASPMEVKHSALPISHIVKEETIEQVVKETIQQPAVNEEIVIEKAIQELVVNEEMVVEETIQPTVNEEMETQEILPPVNEEIEQHTVNEEIKGSIVEETTQEPAVSEEMDQQLVQDVTQQPPVLHEIKQTVNKETEDEAVQQQIVSEELEERVVEERLPQKTVSDETEEQVAQVVIVNEAIKKHIEEITPQLVASEETEERIVPEQTVENKIEDTQAMIQQDASTLTPKVVETQEEVMKVLNEEPVEDRDDVQIVQLPIVEEEKFSVDSIVSEQKSEDQDEEMKACEETEKVPNAIPELVGDVQPVFSSEDAKIEQTANVVEESASDDVNLKEVEKASTVLAQPIIEAAGKKREETELMQEKNIVDLEESKSLDVPTIQDKIELQPEKTVEDKNEATKELEVPPLEEMKSDDTELQPNEEIKNIPEILESLVDKTELQPNEEIKNKLEIPEDLGDKTELQSNEEIKNIPEISEDLSDETELRPNEEIKNITEISEDLGDKTEPQPNEEIKNILDTPEALDLLPVEIDVEQQNKEFNIRLKVEENEEIQIINSSEVPVELKLVDSESQLLPTVVETKEIEDMELQAVSAVEETKEIEPPTEEITAEPANIEMPVEIEPENIEMSSSEDIDLLLQNTVAEVSSPSVSQFDPANDESQEVSTSSIANNILPLAMEDVPDLEVLNAISSLSDNKSDITEMVQESDALLTSSITPVGVSFEPTTLPTVDEIFAEDDPPQEVDLQDDNLETLLAVASLQSDDYNLPADEDFTTQTESFVPEEAPKDVDLEASKFVAIDTPKEVELEASKFVAIDTPKEVELEASKVVEVEAPNNTELEVTRVVQVEAPKVEKVDFPKDIEDMEITKVVEVEARKVKEKEASKHSRPETSTKLYLALQADKRQVEEQNLKEPLVINIDDTDKERVYSPKITIKPIKPPEEEDISIVSSGDTECSKGSLKMTITKQSDNTHSILKIYDPVDDGEQSPPPEPTVPKLIIKPIVEQPHSPKVSTRSSKVFSPSSSNQRSASPRITIKPILKPEEPVAPLKITIKPLKSEESHKQKHSPKLTIKPVLKPDDENNAEVKVHSPRVTIKPIIKPPDEEQVISPRITIKPIVRPTETVTESVTPRVTIKPLVKPPEKEPEIEKCSPKITIKPIVKPTEPECIPETEKSSPKITIKPIVKPPEPEMMPEDFEESIKGRIVLKINKGTIPGSSKDSPEKLAKIKLKFSKEGGHPQIVQEKRPIEFVDVPVKRSRMDTEYLPEVTLTPIAPSTHSKLKEMLNRNDNRIVTIDDDEDDVTIVEEQAKPSPIVISEESNQDSMAGSVDLRDPISEIPVFEITPESVKTINLQPVLDVTAPMPRKRGRPRKVPLQVREEFKDPKEEEPKPIVVESTRPKRSCRGQSARATLGIKPRKPRGPGRGRGSKRGMGTRGTLTPPESPSKAAKEPKLAAKFKELKEESFLLSDKSELKTLEIDDGFQKSPSNSLLAPPQSETSTADRADIVMYEEDTRMSAETSSRAQTPAKQVIVTVDLVEESQSSVQSIQSTATTESVKVRKGPRLEVHQEPEGAVISADQLAEYYWSSNGPFMLQEQVAQFLGIKSFKRKYPNIQRRVVDMQERDFIRESGLAGEAMCDLGLTAVNSSDILDIMYSDFQDKYEEYCKHQRDRQAKDLINKQKALSLAASQEKAKMDITQQAVQSAASWNVSFNKARRDQRKSCMDLQTLTIHFPKGKMKQINKPKIGYYPVALVPGQYTDYYKEFSPTEINNLPLSTLCYEPIIRVGHHEMECDSQTDGSGSESDSSSSGSDSSYSGSSDEDCTLCKPAPKRVAAAL